MTEEMKIALQAINKWLYFGWNFSSEYHEWQSIGGETKQMVLPSFLFKIKWTCNFDHMVDKWILATKYKDSDTYLVRFYCELGIENRQRLLEWVMNNYNDERKIL